MVTIRFCTTSYAPPRVVTLRTNKTEWQHQDIGGTYRGDSWYFNLDDSKYPGKFQGEFEFKFVLDHIHWMSGHENLKRTNPNVTFITYEEHQVHFDDGPDRRRALVVEDGWVQQRLLVPAIDEWRVWDVIVIGSGMGGGIVAEKLTDRVTVHEDGNVVNKAPHVLVLEAGSYLVPEHVANLPRQHQIGRFDKHVWHLWDELQVRDYTNQPDSKYRGGQGINFGGRSVFWGGSIPRMAAWEFEGWPKEIADALLHGSEKRPSYYDLAEQTMKKHTSPDTEYQDCVRKALSEHAELRQWTFEAAPTAVQTVPPNQSSIAAGMFSTADLLMESRLTDIEQGDARLFINLNHPVDRIEPPDTVAPDGTELPLTVYARDRVADEERTFRARRVVLAAGSLESPMVLFRSDKLPKHERVGKGFTDHPVFYSHFRIPPNTPFCPKERGESCKLIARHEKLPFNILIEIGADRLHGRYLDDDILEQQHQATQGGALCEIVFITESPLLDDNTVTARPAYRPADGAEHDAGAHKVAGGEAADIKAAAAVKERKDRIVDCAPWPVVSMVPQQVSDEDVARLIEVRNEIVGLLSGCELPNDRITDEILNTAEIAAAAQGSVKRIPFCRARLGAAGHEVGTLRLGTDQEKSVVDANLRYRDCPQLYVCDLSVFPTSPAANPSLTLGALAIRLADHLRAELGVPSASRDGGGNGH